MCIRTLDLFSGCEGFARAAEQLGGFSTTRFIEIDRDAQRVLAGRTVTPAQAAMPQARFAIALERVKYLWSIVDFP
jgi:site-specific DNA-cytosine methylase